MTRKHLKYKYRLKAGNLGHINLIFGVIYGITAAAPLQFVIVDGARMR